MWGSHSLKAWGYRLGALKGDFNNGDTDWSTFTDDMADYCSNDVSLGALLHTHLCSFEYAGEAVGLEHEFATIIQRQVEQGFRFNVSKGQDLYVTLLKQKELIAQGLKDRFGSWYKDMGEFTPKKSNVKRGYTAGCSLNRIEKIDFNPNSRDHISYKLTKDYGWTPREWTPSGKPKIDERILRKLPYPGCDELFKHFLLSKRISQLAEGDNAWLKLERSGRIHGYVNTNGAITGRCTSTQELEKVLNKDHGIWNLGMNITAPIFNGGRLRSLVQIQESTYENSKQDLIKGILNAFSEIEQLLEYNNRQSEMSNRKK